MTVHSATLENDTQQLQSGYRTVVRKSYIWNTRTVQPLTSLAEYRIQLVNAGHSEELINDIIEGLEDSPLYEGQTR